MHRAASAGPRFYGSTPSPRPNGRGRRHWKHSISLRFGSSPPTFHDDLPAMKPLLDAFWRAAAYCLHPRVILLSILPLLVVGGDAALLGYLYWDTSVTAMRSAMNGWPWLVTLFGWLEAAGVGVLGQWVAPLV